MFFSLPKLKANLWFDIIKLKPLTTMTQLASLIPLDRRLLPTISAPSEARLCAFLMEQGGGERANFF